MRKSLRRLLLLGIVGAIVLALMPSRAATTEIAFAELRNAADGAHYSTQPQDPNVTCDVKTYGSFLVQHTPFVVGELYGKDMGIGEGTCFSFDGKPIYQTHLIVHIEYWNGSKWLRTGYYKEAYKNSKFGANVVTRQVQGTYSGISPFIHHPHRSHAYLWNSRSGTWREAVSPSTWYML